MSLTACRECGAAVPAHSHACPSCGAGMAPVSYAAVHRPATPRPPEEPRRSRWAATAGWAGALAICLLFGSFLYRISSEADRNALEKEEVAREEEHLRRVDSWLQDTSAIAALPDSAGRPVPTSARAKRMWVVGRMLVDRAVWEREVMERHGLAHSLPAALGTARYTANARAHPEMEAYLKGRVAAVTEIRNTSAAWVEGRTTGLARESGMAVQEVRGLFPPGFGGMGPEEARHAELMVEIHRYLVRVDPRVHLEGGDMVVWEREEELHRLEELSEQLDGAFASMSQVRGRRMASESAALTRAIQ